MIKVLLIMMITIIVLPPIAPPETDSSENDKPVSISKFLSL
jgi:hypothetical protein